MTEYATPERQSRATWMTDEGREIYEAWTIAALRNLDYKLVTTANEADRHRFPWNLCNIQEEIGSIIDLAYDTVHEKPESTALGALHRHQGAIFANTTASDFGNDIGAVWAHAGDSLKFGINISLALASDVLSLEDEDEIATNSRCLADLASVLETSRFAELTNRLGAAGFNVYEGAFGGLSRKERMCHLGFEHEFNSGEIPAIIYPDKSGQFTVHPKVIKYLAATMKTQNTKGLKNVGGAIGRLPVVDSQVTSGCPVRRPVNNEDSSAITQTIQWLASIIRYIDESQTPVAAKKAGATALAYLNA